jgi:predicted RNA-binding protein Jag
MADTNLPPEYVSLLKTWGELRDSAIWAAVIIGLFVATCFIIYYIIQYKKSKSSQESKNDRANRISSSNERMNNTLQKINNSMIELASSMNNHKESEEKVVWPIIEGLRSDVKELANRVSGTLDINDSLNIIRIVFFKAIYFEIRDYFNELLYTKESDFKSREQYIADKARTNVGEVLTKYKNILSNFKLSINYNLFFKIDSTEYKERYILVDIIWHETKDYFVSQLKTEQKVEECSLKLFNVIKDYVNTIASEMNGENDVEKKKNEHSDRFAMTPMPKQAIKVDSKLLATPLPFKTNT